MEGGVSVFDELKIIFRITVELAKKRRIIEEQNRNNSTTIGDYINTQPSDERKKAYKDLYDFLNALDFEIVKTIQTVMYIGRDNGNGCSPEEIYVNKKQSLPWSDEKSIEVSQMADKIPLDSYLLEGLEKLKIEL